MAKRVITLLFLLSAAFTAFAQSAETNPAELTAFENNQFDLTGQIPAGWSSVGPGAYQSPDDPTTITRLIVQRAPFGPTQTFESLLPQLGLDAIPNIIETIETGTFRFERYGLLIDQLGGIAVDIALAEDAGTTVLVLLQYPLSEDVTLRDEVFLPVVNSLAPLNDSAPDDQAAQETEETPRTYISEDVTFESVEGVTLAGTFTYPADADGPVPGVILITGSGPQDRNESLGPTIALQPFADLADYLSSNGVAVLRYDDRGVAESTGDYASATLDDFAADARAALDYLASREEVAAHLTGALGHSEGGWTLAIMSATTDELDFAIFMGGAAVSLRETLLAQYEASLQTAGVPEAEIRSLTGAQADLLNAITEAAESDNPAEVIEPALRDLVTLQLRQAPDDAFVEQLLAEYTRPWWFETLDYDPADDLATLDVPTLVLLGSLDLQVPLDQNLPIYEAIVANRENARIQIIEEANHLFQEAETGLFSEYATLEPELMSAFLEAVQSFIIEQTQ